MNLKICGIPILDSVYGHLEIDEMELFNLWAFGKRLIVVAEFVPLWNKLHGAAMFINEDSIELDCARMIVKLWEGR